jgi:hypothetical protein
MLGVNVKQFLIIDECSAINMICSQSGTFCFSFFLFFYRRIRDLYTIASNVYIHKNSGKSKANLAKLWAFVLQFLPSCTNYTETKDLLFLNVRKDHRVGAPRILLDIFYNIKAIWSHFHLS